MTEEGKGSILLVEDDLALAESVAAYLRKNGHAVEIATRGDVAIERILSGAADLVLLDIELPGRDGISVCRE